MHTGAVEKATDAEMAAYLEERIAGIAIPKEISGEYDPDTESFGTVPNPEYQAKVDYETERAQAGWNATCSCGWTGNNPHASEADAKEAVDAHYASVEAQLAGLGG